MLALFAIVLLAVLDIIFCSVKAVYIINALLVAGSLLGIAVKLYRKWRELNRLNVQLALGVLLVLSGLTLIFVGLFIQPKGEIHNSVLIAYGEISTFAGALIGVDYHYRYRDYERRLERKGEEKTDGEG